MSLPISGVISGNGAEVDTSNRLLAVNPKTQDSAGNPLNLGGGDRLAVEVDSGIVTGSPTNRSLNASEFRKLKVGIDSILFHEFFNGTAINTTQWSTTLSTFTTSVAGGRATLNSSSSLTANAYAVLKSYRTVPIYSGFPTVFEAVMTYSAATAAVPNTVVELGLGYATTNAAPTDGVFFRWNAAGNFLCVVSYNGAETVSAPITPPLVNDSYFFKIVIGALYVEFWIDGILQAKVTTPAGAGNPVATQNLPVLHRVYNSSSSPTSAVQTSLYSVSAYLADQLSNRSYEIALAGLGAGAYQGQTGQTLGSTANHTNSTAAAGATLSNTTPGYTKLGGRFLFNAPAGASTDYALFGFQVPVASVNVPGKTLYIRGIHISSVNIGAAVATTPTILEWAIGVGSTAASLATTEAATTKAPRVIDLGVQSFLVGAAVGQPVNDLDVQFAYPLMCEAGNYVHVIVAVPVGTATASQQVMGTVAINAVWE